ncbi:MAG: hypothetical protein PHX44_07490 [Sulfurimonas sp.]|uniref:hypothetical protein n=1 Tax=Sulfurimonas sp. TaxID=2022749 RepID=UPI00260C2372|nr:hypothetical protein [Sulfurimonas sp.]MDD2652877.1 hypothetical protein [Sulfurimonas sp.]MDD3452323.1 hypothetical protein [Sulfurimonas sp.]
MYILVPMDDNDLEEAHITAINEATVWVQLLVEEGRVVETNTNQDKDAFENQSQILVVKDDNEYVWPFIELGMMVLVAHIQRSVDDIVEAYLFRELNELRY